jgi:hypothetical protein
VTKGPLTWSAYRHLVEQRCDSRQPGTQGVQLSEARPYGELPVVGRQIAVSGIIRLQRPPTHVADHLRHAIPSRIVQHIPHRQARDELQDPVRQPRIALRQGLAYVVVATMSFW